MPMRYYKTIKFKMTIDIRAGIKMHMKRGVSNRPEPIWPL